MTGEQAFHLAAIEPPFPSGSLEPPPSLDVFIDDYDPTGALNNPAQLGHPSRNVDRVLERLDGVGAIARCGGKRQGRHGRAQR